MKLHIKNSLTVFISKTSLITVSFSIIRKFLGGAVDSTYVPLPRTVIMFGCF